jgi:hypothetical protein
MTHNFNWDNILILDKEKKNVEQKIAVSETNKKIYIKKNYKNLYS